jgi:hypothetical protein
VQYGFVCIVTGATWPIGKAITLELAGESLITLSSTVVRLTSDI